MITAPHAGDHRAASRPAGLRPPGREPRSRPHGSNSPRLARHPGRPGRPEPAVPARSAVIMARRVVTEDHAGEHAPGVPGSRTSS
jgi:hypothetical protein